MHALIRSGAGAMALLLSLSGKVFAAEYFVAPDGDDANPGTMAEPFASLTHAFDQLAEGDTLTLREGVYRLVQESGPGALVVDGVTLRGYPGEQAVLLGSASTEGRLWQDMGANIWRLPAEFLDRDPTGMFQGETRMTHATDFSDGRDHGGTSLLEEDNQWTKADVNGQGCDQSNDGCYIYLRPAAGENPNDHIYELSQRSLTRVVGDHVTIRNLEFYYTQPQPVFFEAADFALIEDSVFGHTSNGNDNSYGLRIWDSQGTIVRNNRVFDSVYWGGVANSKGITFMVTKPGAPNIVELNEIYDIPGFSAVGTKNGTANLIVRYNLIYDVYTAFEPGDARCVWSSSNTDGCQPEDEEYRPGGGWQIYGNIVRNADVGVRLPGYIDDGHNNRVFNNVFDNVETGIELGWDGTYGHNIANNIFIDNRAAFYLHSGGTTTSVHDYLDQFTSDNNLFFANTMADIHLRPNWGGGYSSGTSYALSEFQSEFSREFNSLAFDPQFVDAPLDYHLESFSPARAAGDGGFWGRSGPVDIGAYAFFDMLFASRFDDADRRR